MYSYITFRCLKVLGRSNRCDFVPKGIHYDYAGYPSRLIKTCDRCYKHLHRFMGDVTQPMIDWGRCGNYGIQEKWSVNHKSDYVRLQLHLRVKHYGRHSVPIDKHSVKETIVFGEANTIKIHEITNYKRAHLNFSITFKI